MPLSHHYHWEYNLQEQFDKHDPKVTNLTLPTPHFEIRYEDNNIEFGFISSLHFLRLVLKIVFLSIYPVAVFFDEVDELVDGGGLGDVALDDLLAFVEGYLARTLSYIAVVRISHLARAVDDAAHDTYLDALEVLGARLYLLQGLLDVVLRAAARGAGDVFTLADTCPDSLKDAVGHGNLLDGVFGEGDTDGVADAIDKQCTDAGSTLVTRFHRIARFGDAKMDGIVHTEGVHLLDKEACALHHHLHVAGFHGEDKLVVVLLAAHLGKLDGGLGHSLGGVAVTAHDALAERAVVGADAHGGVVLLAYLDEARHLLPYPLKLVGVLLFGEMGLAGVSVGIVAGIDTHLLHDRGSRLGGEGVEMDVRHQRDSATATSQLVLDVIEVLRRLDVGGCDAYQLAAGFNKAQGLLDGGLGVHGVGVGHGLDSDGGSTA